MARGQCTRCGYPGYGATRELFEGGLCRSCHMFSEARTAQLKKTIPLGDLVHIENRLKHSDPASRKNALYQYRELTSEQPSQKLQDIVTSPCVKDKICQRLVRDGLVWSTPSREVAQKLVDTHPVIWKIYSCRRWNTDGTYTSVKIDFFVARTDDFAREYALNMWGDGILERGDGEILNLKPMLAEKGINNG